MPSIDEYLQQLARQLPRHLHADVLPEVRSHLQEAAADWQRRGLPLPQAEARAVAQFGPVRTISRELKGVHGVVGWGDAVLAALPVLGITGLGWYLVGYLLPLWWYLLAFGWGALFAWRRNWPTWWYAWLGWLFLALGVVDGTQTFFWVLFPLVITLIALESWEQATLMALPFTTYLTFLYLLSPSPVLQTTGWGPGSIYPGNIVWVETAFSILWIGLLALSIKTARPHRRGVYLVAGLLTMQILYLGALFISVILSTLLPHLFVSAITFNLTFKVKLPLALLSIGLTLYPRLVAYCARWARRPRQPGQPGLFVGE